MENGLLPSSQRLRTYASRDKWSDKTIEVKPRRRPRGTQPILDNDGNYSHPDPSNLLVFHARPKRAQNSIWKNLTRHPRTTILSSHSRLSCNYPMEVSH